MRLLQRALRGEGGARNLDKEKDGDGGTPTSTNKNGCTHQDAGLIEIFDAGCLQSFLADMIGTVATRPARRRRRPDLD